MTESLMTYGCNLDSPTVLRQTNRLPLLLYYCMYMMRNTEIRNPLAWDDNGGGPVLYNTYLYVLVL